MANTRALQFKKNAAELAEKLEDVKRLKGALQKFINEALKDQARGGEGYGAVQEICAPKKGVPSIEIELFSEVEDDLELRLLSDGTPLARDGQWTLAMVRATHDNLDALIEFAEKFCKKLGRLKELQSQFARFS